MKRVGIPLYWSKYSRRDYTIRQHIMLIVLARYVGSIERILHGLMFFGGMNEHRKMRASHLSGGYGYLSSKERGSARFQER